jgi:putative transposase
MANTYTQLYIMSVFAVKHRHGLIQAQWKERLYQYITGTVQNRGHKMIRINGMPDHVHLFIGLHPNESVSKLIQEVKEQSSKWINQQQCCRGHFSWQDGYGAFTYARSQIDRVARYIENQEEHHRRHSFLEEYRQLLRSFEINFDERYVFHEPV